MTLHALIKLLLGLALGLPLLQATLLWVRSLLAAMGDEPAAAVVGHVGTAAGVLWLVALVGLVLTMAINTLQPPRE